MKPENLLIVGDSERDANLLYATGRAMSEPFIYLRLRGRNFAVLPDLELRRARRRLRDCEVLSISAYQRRLKSPPRRSDELAPVIREILREHRLKKVVVPGDFPLALARDLRNHNVKLKLQESPLFPNREFKTANEIKRISASLTMAEVGLSEGLLALRSAKIGRNRQLTYHNAPLTAEKLRAVIDTATLQAGGYPTSTIVACGRQSADPVETGQGPLRANEPIILSVAPRSRRTGYHAAITRTVVKGRPSETVRQHYRAVSQALDLAASQLRAHSCAGNVHLLLQRFFDQQGFTSRQRKGSLQRLVLCTGHGLGLDLHEKPTITTGSTDIILPGQVLALQPALYFRPQGGVRIEDILLVTSNGARNLTKFEKNLEI
jgi:Xaa-Pro aminopeptidase